VLDGVVYNLMIWSRFVKLVKLSLRQTFPIYGRLSTPSIGFSDLWFSRGFAMMSSEAKRPCLEEDIAVTNFRRYLRINTSQPNPDYGMNLIY